MNVLLLKNAIEGRRAGFAPMTPTMTDFDLDLGRLPSHVSNNFEQSSEGRSENVFAVLLLLVRTQSGR